MTAAPRPSEFQLQASVVDLLRRCADPTWRWVHIASGEYRSKSTAGRLKAMGVNRGWPDLMFVGPRGRICFVELKRPGGRLSPDQRAVAEHLRQAGHGFACVEAIDDAVAALVGWGVIRGVHVQ